MDHVPRSRDRGHQLVEDGVPSLREGGQVQRPRAGGAEHLRAERGGDDLAVTADDEQALGVGFAQPDR